jgi:hypothetical protein
LGYRHCNESIEIYKLKKFTCKSLKGKGNRSGIRVIYIFENNKVHFVEIYHKNTKPNMDYKRVNKFLCFPKITDNQMCIDFII